MILSKIKKGGCQTDSFKFRCLLLESTIKSLLFQMAESPGLVHTACDKVSYIQLLRGFPLQRFWFLPKQRPSWATVHISIAPELVLNWAGLAFYCISHLKWQKGKQQGNENSQMDASEKKTMQWINYCWKWQKSGWVITPNRTLKNFLEGRVWQIQYCINPEAAIKTFEEGLHYLEQNKTNKQKNKPLQHHQTKKKSYDRR